jgi:uncharacterized protein YjiK
MVARRAGKLRALAYDADISTLYVAAEDKGLIRVQPSEDARGENAAVRIMGDLSAAIKEPSGLAIGPKGEIWIADEEAESIILSSRSGTIVGRIGNF